MKPKHRRRQIRRKIKELKTKDAGELQVLIGLLFVVGLVLCALAWGMKEQNIVSGGMQTSRYGGYSIEVLSWKTVLAFGTALVAGAVFMYLEEKVRAKLNARKLRNLEKVLKEKERENSPAKP
ncbi:MAG: hypothetical protein EP332_13575 [Bacteroidetes bacterium]|nr:MAG: hypothetical protein EP332_13575 [Bacteroidota bacterium]